MADAKAERYLNQCSLKRCFRLFLAYLFIRISGKMKIIMPRAQSSILKVWSCQKATKRIVQTTDKMFLFPPKGI